MPFPLSKRSLGNKSLFEVRHSSIHGKGVFAVSDLLPGDVVGVALVHAGDSGDPDKDLVRTTLGKYSNHSSRPNATLTSIAPGRLAIAALRPIAEDEEILVDYAEFGRILDAMGGFSASGSLPEEDRHGWRTRDHHAERRPGQALRPGEEGDQERGQHRIDRKSVV